MAELTSPEFSRRRWLGLVATPALAATLPSGLLAQSHGGAAPGANLPAAPQGARSFDIRAFGAKGDGVTLDTTAVQAALDAAHASGGGIVIVPTGVFVIGTVEMKSNVTLHLTAQGKLLGSADGKQYRAAEAIPTRGEHTMGDGNVGLIFAANAENIAIEGSGTIDGQGAQFRRPAGGGQPPAGISGNQRPHHLLFYKCTNLTVRGIFLTACAYHSVRVCVCTYATFDGLRIYSRVNSNNDGFHFISSQFVHVSNCDVQCQDDACALFGSCKFVTVVNCTFSTRWSVFRFGTGEAENIVVSNCIIHSTYGCPIKLRCDSRSRFENISFSNLVLKDVTGPISIGLGQQRPQPGVPAPKPGIARNISFNGIRATVVKPVRLPDTDVGGPYNEGEIFSCIILNGMDAGFIENVSFHDVHVTFPGGGTKEQGAVRDVPKLAAEYYAIGVPPAHGLYARNVRGLTLSNVRFETAQPDLRPAVIFDRVEDASVNGLSVHGQREAESVLRFIDSRDVLITAARVLTPATVFLQIEGNSTAGITLDGGDLTKAAKPLVAVREAAENAVKLRI
jgi:hypothetical protein